MLEKTGMLQLNQKELEEIKKGNVPSHIKDGWGSSEAKELVKSGEYVLVDSPSKSETK